MTTTNLRTSARRAASWLDRLFLPPALIVAVLVFIVAGAVSAIGQLRSGAVAAAVPTPALPIILIATSQPTTPPTAAALQVAAVLPHALTRAVVAYDSPNGAAIGAIEQGRAYTVLARYGADWLQAEVSGSGAVWLRADQVLDLPPGLVDLAPTPAPQLVYVAAPALAAPTAPAPQAPTEETAPTLAPEQLVILDRQRWAEQAVGGSGKSAAPVFPTLAPASDSAAQWCAAVASAGRARCTP